MHLTHSGFYRDIREAVEKSPDKKYFKCGGCHSSLDSLDQWRTHLIENAYIQSIKHAPSGQQSVLSFYATKCRLNAIQSGLDQLIQKSHLLSFRQSENELAQLNEKFNDSYKFILGENSDRNFYFLCPECNETVSSTLKVEMGQGGKDARTNSNSFLQVIWDHFKTKHTQAQPHAWKLYEKSCEKASNYKMFPCFGCQTEFGKINDWNLHKFSKDSANCPYYLRKDNRNEVIPMVIQATLNTINKKGFSVRHDRSIRCPLCYFVGETMSGMSEHFRTHLTEATNRNHVREALRTTKLLECEDCKIRFMKMEDLRLAHDDASKLDPSKYDLPAIKDRIANCNLFKNYEFFAKHIEAPKEEKQDEPKEEPKEDAKEFEVVAIESGATASNLEATTIDDSDDEPILTKIQKNDSAEKPVEEQQAVTEQRAPDQNAEAAESEEPAKEQASAVIVSVEEVRIPPPEVRKNAEEKEPNASFSASDLDNNSEEDTNTAIGDIVDTLDATLGETDAPLAIENHADKIQVESTEAEIDKSAPNNDNKPSKPKERRRTKTKGTVSNQPLTFPCPQCDAAQFKTFSQMDEHFRITHDTADYVTFRRADYDLIKMTQKCDDCGFKFPSEEEYFEHFAMCDHYRLDTSGGGGRRKRRSARLAEEPKPKAIRLDEDVQEEEEEAPDEDGDFEVDYVAEEDPDSEEDEQDDDGDFEPDERPSSSTVTQATKRISKPPKPKEKTTSKTHLYDKELEQPNGAKDLAPNEDTRQVCDIPYVKNMLSVRN